MPQEIVSVTAVLVAVGAGRVISSSVAELVRAVPAPQTNGSAEYSCWPTRMLSSAEVMAVPDKRGSIETFPVFVTVVALFAEPASEPGEIVL